MSKLTESIPWKALEEHNFNIKNLHLRDIFYYDEMRFQKFHVEWNDFLFDHSKNRINFDTISHFLDLAKKSRLKFAIDDMFKAKQINFTEKRSVLHTALRDMGDDPIELDGIDIKQEIIEQRQKMKEISQKIISGEWKGADGETITDVVNIGIGGSDLGPRMVCETLVDFHKRVKVHFVSNVDRRDINKIMLYVDPQRTVFIITSKSFSTQETLTNAKTAKNWMIRTGIPKDKFGQHFIAVSTNIQACVDFGIPEENILKMWDWVGGRFSLWSTVGLPIAIQIGYNNFEKLLEGAYEADQHFKTADYNKNIPVLMAFLAIWYRNFHKADSQAVIPYNQDMMNFSAYLQQLEMESNGKYIDKDGEKVDYDTNAVIFGEPGTNSQHSFFQMIHQGTQLIPVDFIAFTDFDQGDEHNQKLLANMLGQSAALMQGKKKEEVIQELESSGLSQEEIKNLLPHKVFKGNNPSTTILIKELNPKNLGSLIAFYEHKVFVQGVIWNINSFDQWGVELGKQLANKILAPLGSKDETDEFDASTNALINWIKD